MMVIQTLGVLVILALQFQMFIKLVKILRNLGVDFQKKPDDGNMKGLAFIKDPDGYWIEILSSKVLKI